MWRQLAAGTSPDGAGSDFLVTMMAPHFGKKLIIPKVLEFGHVPTQPTL